MELESIKKIQFERIVEMNYLEIWAETTEARFINRKQEMSERIPETEDMCGILKEW